MLMDLNRGSQDDDDDDDDGSNVKNANWDNTAFFQSYAFRHLFINS
jgi:hypothetical protein